MSLDLTKKFQEMIVKAMSSYHDSLIEKVDAEGENFSFDKESLDLHAAAFFGLSKKSDVKAKKSEVKVKKPHVVPEDTERCTVIKKDLTRCNGGRIKGGEICQIHINAEKKKAALTEVPETPNADEATDSAAIAPKKKSSSSKKAAVEASLDPPFETETVATVIDPVALTPKKKSSSKAKAAVPAKKFEDDETL